MTVDDRFVAENEETKGSMMMTKMSIVTSSVEDNGVGCCDPLCGRGHCGHHFGFRARNEEGVLCVVCTYVSFREEVSRV
jgi:hypothetical protein